MTATKDKIRSNLYLLLPWNWGTSASAQLLTLRGKHDDLIDKATTASLHLVDVNANVERLEARVKTLTTQRDKHEHQSEFVTNMYVAEFRGITTETPVTHLTNTVPLIPRRFRIVDGTIVAKLEYLYADNMGIEKKTVTFPVKDLELI